MKRVLLAAAIVALTLGGLTACSDDSKGTQPDLKPSADRAPASDRPAVNREQGPGADKPAGGDKAPSVDKSTCIAKTTPGPGGMNAGMACIGSNCHATPQPGISSPMTIGGTVYTAQTGGTGVGGVTVEAIDSTGKVVTMVTGSTGNFWSTTSVTPPLKVRVSGCPDDKQMASTPSTGNCNTCHGSSNRMHLP